MNDDYFNKAIASSTKLSREERWLRALVVGASLVWTIAAGRAIAADERPIVLFLGTSLSAGYGIPPAEAFPALIQQKIDRADLLFRVVNAGVTGDTSAGGLRRIDRLLKTPVSVLVLELGANDMLRGLDPGAMQANLTGILERTRAAYPDAKLLIAGIRAAPRLGQNYRRRFEPVFRTLARTFDAPLIPFLLKDVAAKPKLNQVDGIHPTAEGHRLIAETVWRKLAPLLRE